VNGPPTGDEEAMSAWIARQAGRSITEVRNARRRSSKRHSIPVSETDRVRASVSAALSDRRLVTEVANSIGSSGTIARRRPRPSTTTTTSSTDPHRARANAYGGEL